MLRESAFAYVEKLERECDVLRARNGELNAELESARKEPVVDRVARDLTRQLQAEINRSVDLRRSVEAAVTNLNIYERSPATTTLAAVHRNLKEALEKWRRAA